VDLKMRALTVITGVSGAGKTSLLEEAAERLRAPGSPFARVISVSADPIGRTPRSNAATYSGAFDLIRNLFAATPEARLAGLGKGAFTFNTAGGRCETCEGAGVLEVGLRHLGTVTVPCETCQGRRFHEDVLQIRYRGQSIAEVLEGSIEAALQLFRDQPALARILAALVDCGLGYLPLGQPATTLSGGEAQRVKLATELARTGHAPAFLALDEPTVGLHRRDVAVLLRAWDRLLEAGHTLLVVDNDQDVLRAADHLIDLGPGSGPEGGRVVVAGSLAAVAACAASLTGSCLGGGKEPPPEAPKGPVDQPMAFTGITTHNLQHLDVAIPARGLTVVTGPSGCGKSSLVFDTLLAEAQNRFADLVAPWARRLLPRRGGAELVSARGLRAAVAVPQRPGRRNPRSRVGTVAGVDELLRLLFARAGVRSRPEGEALPPALWASAFSPNTQAGGCPGCKGLGFIQACDPGLLVTHPDRALDAGAMDGTAFGAYLGEAQGQFMATLQAVGAALGVACSGPWNALGARAQALAMHGAGDRVFEVAWRYRRGQTEGIHLLKTPWAGLATLVDREYERIHLDARGEALEVLLAERPCPLCQGERLKAEARAVRYEGLRFPEAAAMPVAQLCAWLGRARPEPLTEALRGELRLRLEALDNAGLGYLAPDREVASLSGGEAQRLRLAAALEGGLSGVAYVLDEPTQGLHPRDSLRLAGVLRGLAEAGNAVVVVEHDPLLIARADYIIELGPGAGPDGGRLLASGSPAALRADPGSRTGRMLLKASAPRVPRPGRPGVTLRGVTLRNLDHLDLDVPLGALVAVTDVSGSGKSTLVRDVLGASLRARLRGRPPVGCASLELHEPLGAVLALGQAPPAAGGASTVATLCGVGEALRKRFAATPRAKVLKLTARHFSTAGPGGRCEACAGRGVLTVTLDLLPDVTVGCEACGGQRFLPPVLECRIGERTITQVLEATLEDVARAFSRDAAVAGPLQALMDTGLGYLRLGQEARTLSEGEGQRLRLAGLLASAPAQPSAILLDEPTRGLGAAEVQRLLAVLGRLVEAGHLVVAVEHDLGFIAAADWVMDLGPGGGPEGGALVAAGPPAALRACAASHTGAALRDLDLPAPVGG
jgi:excinuclease ABC subunit A